MQGLVLVGTGAATDSQRVLPTPTPGWASVSE